MTAVTTTETLTIAAAAQPIRLADAKRRLTPGTVLDVTNHYIRRVDHPCYGTRRATVTAANGSAFYLDGARNGRIPWPKASQVAEDPMTGALLLFGGGAGQNPDELFLTLTPVEPCVRCGSEPGAEDVTCGLCGHLADHSKCNDCREPLDPGSDNPYCPACR